MKGKGDEEGSKGRKRKRKKEEEGETTPRSRLPGSALAARWLSPVNLRLRGGGLRRRAARDVIAPRRLVSPPAASRVPALCNRVALVPGPAGGSRSPWVAASPLAFGFLPGQPRWRQEGDNCSETQHLSGPVVQGAREGEPRAAALTPQRPGMRAGARGERGSRGAPPGVPLEQPLPSSGKRSRVIS